MAQNIAFLDTDTGKIKNSGVGSPILYEQTDFKRFAHIDEDWLSGSTPGKNGWANTTTGGASAPAVSTADSSATEWGVIEQRSGTTSGAGSAFALTNARMNLANANWNLSIKTRVSALSNEATNNYTVRTGLSDNANASIVPSNGIFFEYSTASSANWRCCLAKAGTRTYVDSGIAVTTTYQNLEAVATGGEVKFYVNAVLAATISTNYPNTAVCWPSMNILKGSVGTTQVTLNTDWYTFRAQMTTQRAAGIL